MAGSIVCGCGQDSSTTEQENDVFKQEQEQQVEDNMKETANIAAYFEGFKASEYFKGVNDQNPLMTQRFGADPYAMVYGDRVYFYMTADTYEYDENHEIKENSYSIIRSINVISTDDMVNFTDHGAIQVAGPQGAAKWAGNSWAPAATWKEIDGKPRFFLYFANSGGGIGVLQADSPVGPFTDPLGKELISRNTPNCADVLWLFDPAVLLDDDGRGYLYFGGGVPHDKIAAPGTGRVVELGEDMISVKGEAKAIDIPYLFEDSGIHKYKDKYYYTYCTNWQVDQAGTDKYGFHNAEIACLESDSPMGPFTYKETILENPGKYCGLYGNNHHCVFSFKNEWYMTYHSRLLEKNMKVEHGYRATHVDKFVMGEDGTIGTIKQTQDSRTQLQYVNPYVENSAVNMAVMGGLNTAPLTTAPGSEMILTEIHTGDFMKVAGVDFGDSAPTKWNAFIRTLANKGERCAIQIRVDRLFGDVIGYLAIEDAADFTKLTATLEAEVTGVHDLYLLFSGEGYEMKSWSFER